MGRAARPARTGLETVGRSATPVRVQNPPIPRSDRVDTSMALSRSQDHNEPKLAGDHGITSPPLEIPETRVAIVLRASGNRCPSSPVELALLPPPEMRRVRLHSVAFVVAKSNFWVACPLPISYVFLLAYRVQYSPLGSQFRGFILSSGVRDRGEAGDPSCR